MEVYKLKKLASTIAIVNAPIFTEIVGEIHAASVAELALHKS